MVREQASERKARATGGIHNVEETQEAFSWSAQPIQYWDPFQVQNQARAWELPCDFAEQLG